MRIGFQVLDLSAFDWKVVNVIASIDAITARKKSPQPGGAG
jgi:hypothetical protein